MNQHTFLMLMFQKQQQNAVGTEYATFIRQLVRPSLTPPKDVTRSIERTRAVVAAQPPNNPNDAEPAFS